MGLFDFFKKKEPPKIEVNMVGYENGEKEDLIEQKGEKRGEDWKKQLSMSLTLDSKIRPLENSMVGFADALSHRQKVDDEIVMLESLIEYYNEIKRKCYVLGPDYIDYFTKAWAEARKGKPDGPDYITRYKNRLVYLRERVVGNSRPLFLLRRRPLPSLPGNCYQRIANKSLRPGIVPHHFACQHRAVQFRREIYNNIAAGLRRSGHNSAGN